VAKEVVGPVMVIQYLVTQWCGF